MSDKDEEGGTTYRAKEKRQSKQSTVVDDQFFKLSEMSKFLDLEDQRETRRHKKDEQTRKGMRTIWNSTSISGTFFYFNLINLCK